MKLASARVDEVLDNMVEAGFLSPEQARSASQQPLKLRAKGDDTGYPYPVDWVAELLPEFVGEHDGDLIVETTIDAGLQRVSQQALRRMLDGEGAALAAGEGAVVVLDPMGGVKALVGGRSYQHKPVRPRAQGAPAAGLGLQALRLSRGAGERLYAGFRRL